MLQHRRFSLSCSRSPSHKALSSPLLSFEARWPSFSVLATFSPDPQDDKAAQASDDFPGYLGRPLFRTAFFSDQAVQDILQYACHAPMKNCHATEPPLFFRS